MDSKQFVYRWKIITLDNCQASRIILNESLPRQAVPNKKKSTIKQWFYQQKKKKKILTVP